MPPTNPRIIVVDAHHTLHHIVRAALELMGRRPRLIETYMGDDALLELRTSSADLLISAQTLAEEWDGPTLANLAKRELAALPIIVIGEETDPELDPIELAESPFQYLRRPFAPEMFLRQIRIALDGPEAAPKETAAEEIIPVPMIDAEKLRPHMYELMREVKAMAVVLADRNGKVVAYEGAAGYFDRDLIAAALAPGFGATTRLLSTIGEQPRILKHFDAERGNVFALAVGLHHFMMLFFEGSAPAAALGNVKRYGGSAVNTMLNVIGPVAFDPKPVSIKPPAATRTEQAHAVGKRRSRTHTQEMTAVRGDSAEKSDKGEKAERHESSRARSRSTSTVPAVQNFDASLLDSLDKLDMSKADELFDPDKLARTGMNSSGERISYDDAMMQGIIGNMDEDR